MFLNIILFCVFTMAGYSAAGQINKEEKTNWEPPLKNVLVHTVINGRRDSARTDAAGKFLQKKQFSEVYLHFVYPGYDSLKAWIMGRVFYQINIARSAKRIMLNTLQEALRLNKARMKAFQWKDILSSHDSVNYRLESAGTGVLLEFG